MDVRRAIMGPLSHLKMTLRYGGPEYATLGRGFLIETRCLDLARSIASFLRWICRGVTPGYTPKNKVTRRFEGMLAHIALAGFVTSYYSALSAYYGDGRPLPPLFLHGICRAKGANTSCPPTITSSNGRRYRGVVFRDTLWGLSVIAIVRVSIVWIPFCMGVTPGYALCAPP